MSTRPKHLGHVNLYVRNAERSKGWYENLLGLHTYEYREGWAAFMSADTDQSHEVALMQLGDDAPLQQRRQVLYERFFASDPLTRARAMAAVYPKGQVMERVLDFLGKSDEA